MRRLPRVSVAPLCYAVLALACWPLPLLQVLHAESMALLAFFAYFIAGTAVLKAPGIFAVQLRTQLGWLLVPLGLWTVTLAWAPNCGYFLGLLFFLLFPGVTVVFSVALAWAIAGTRWRRKALWLWVIGLLVALVPVAYDLGFHPQFYTYNHVFGGVLGPIYDEELALRPGLFAFRALTLLWAAFFVCVGKYLRSQKAVENDAGIPTPESRRQWVRLGALLLVCIGVVYGCAAPLGINTPAWLLKRQLGGHERTAHYDVYFDPAAITPEQVRRLAWDHEFRYAQLASRLGQQIPQRIQSYLYPSADVKARLTGARYTSVAPVWLAAPQTHVLLDRYETTFPHELAHVFSRPHGLPLLNAPLQAGLVEGWAVALEPPDDLPSPHAQVAAAAALFGDNTLAERLAASLSPQGFWTGRSAVSYTTTGSFVQWLLDTYGPARLAAVYEQADFERAYGQPVDTLAVWWERFIQRQPVTPMAETVVLARFTRPSLFEKPCPHHVPAYVRHTRNALVRLAEGDTTRALGALGAALAEQPGYEPAIAARADVLLARGEPVHAIEFLNGFFEQDTLAAPALQLLLGDAYALAGRPAEAEAAWATAERQAPLYARDSRALVHLRASLSPQALARYHAAGPPGLRADRLQPLAAGSPAVAVLQALLYAEAEQPGRAMVVLPETLGDPVLNQRLLVWRARMALQAGALSDAEKAILDAHPADPYEAAFLGDMKAKVRWLRQNRF